MKSYDKSKYQCGRIHILLGLYTLPGEALTYWWLSIAMGAPAVQLPECFTSGPRVTLEFASFTPLEK